jgi:hypothetical protein
MTENILNNLYKEELPKDITPDGQFPKNTLRRYEGLLSSFNISTKAITLLLLDDHPISPYGELYQKFKTVYKGSNIASFAFPIPALYCQDSLSPFGLTERTQDGVSLTPEGVLYGYPAAMKFLKFERDTETSLYPIFGRTATVGNFRPPLATAMVLFELSKTFKAQGEIVDSTDLPADSIRIAVERLARWGFVDKEGILQRAGETKVQYQRTDEPLLSTLTHKNELMEEIIVATDLLTKADEEINQTTVFERISDAIKKEHTEPNIKSRIRYYLPQLVESGILHRSIKGGGEGRIQTQVKILSLGERLREELLVPVLELVQDPTGWKDKDELTRDVMDNLSEYARVTGDLYFPFSKSAIKLYPNKFKDMLISELQVKSGQSASQLAKKIGIDAETTRGYLQRTMLADNSQISKTQIKSVYYYHFGTN